MAAAWAPTFLQETSSPKDFITAFDYDGDWVGSNNAANLHRFPLRAVVYYTAFETETHWFLTYVLYHPVDDKRLTGHDHDTEHVTLVVRKSAQPAGRLEAMETRFHKSLLQYVPPGNEVGDGADDIDGPIHLDERGRPLLYVQRVGHGICGGYAPQALIPALALYCSHHRTPHLARRGVVYRYAGQAAAPRSLDDRDVGYALVEIGESWWPRATQGGPNATFATIFDFQSARCRTYLCPSKIGRLIAPSPGRASTGMPWEEGSGRGAKRIGEAFFDPAYVLGQRLRFPAPFSTKYRYNPYLGVGRFPDPSRVAER